jgi:DNA-binding protein YbaB
MSPPACAATALSRPGVKQALAYAGRTLSSKRVVGEAAAGRVRATLGGDGRVISLDVAPEVGKEHWLVHEHIAVAINRAHDQLREVTREAVKAELPPNVELSMILRAAP